MKKLLLTGIAALSVLSAPGAHAESAGKPYIKPKSPLSVDVIVAGI